MQEKRAIIIGAGPAGLTAAWELLTRARIRPLVLEKSEYMGGISRTVNYKGNRIDMGGHRFFSKSDRVMEWWMNILPLERGAGNSTRITYQGAGRDVTSAGCGPDPGVTDLVMLVRSRRSRIYCMRRFFDYPVALSADTLLKLGPLRTARIGASYVRSALFPIRGERTLEQFFINRFGRELYETFFRSYTEKVWGVPCTEISAEWGAQRIKGLSVWKTLQHAAGRAFRRKRRGDLGQKNTQTSLIDQFLYPKFGPGQMWEETARQVRQLGGTILTGYRASRMVTEGTSVRAIEAVNTATGETESFGGDFFFSTAPVKELVGSLDPPAPSNVREVAEGLVYRDFITVGLLVKKMKIAGAMPRGRGLVPDNWIYIQEPDVSLGRLQVFNNWSPWLVRDPSTVWLGLEYFCNEGDALWSLSDENMLALARAELTKIGIIEDSDVIDGTVLRMEKTYPAYFGTYARFGEVRDYVDRFGNLFLIGRNGMHKYNNQDHSMLTAMMAVDNILAGITTKDNLWKVNTEMEYHEEQE